MWCLYKDLGGGDAPTDESTASAAVLADPEQEAFSPRSLKNLCFSTVALRPSHRSAGRLTLRISKINCTCHHLFT